MAVENNLSPQTKHKNTYIKKSLVKKIPYLEEEPPGRFLIIILKWSLSKILTFKPKKHIRSHNEIFPSMINFSQISFHRLHSSPKFPKINVWICHKFNKKYILLNVKKYSISLIIMIILFLCMDKFSRKRIGGTPSFMSGSCIGVFVISTIFITINLKKIHIEDKTESIFPKWT